MTGRSGDGGRAAPKAAGPLSRRGVGGAVAAAALLAAAPGAALAQARPAGCLAGKVAFVTGAARGIGRATAVALAREGADVALFDIAAPVETTPYPMSAPADLAETERLVRSTGRQALAARGDVRDMPAVRAAVDRTIRELGRVDILHANAGVSGGVLLAEMSDRQWAETIDINLTGAANSMRAAIPHMLARGGGGRIILTSSDIGRRGIAERSHYGASKWGLIGLAKGAAQELASAMITVNAVCPGQTRSGISMNYNAFRRFVPGVENPTEEQAEARVRARNAENRELPIAWLDAEDIANAVVFLASEEGRYITGTALDVTGGKSSHYSA